MSKADSLDLIELDQDEEEQETIQLSLEKIVQLTERQSLDYLIAQSQKRQAKSFFIGSFAPLLPSIVGQQSVEKFDGGEIFFGATPVNLNRVTYRPTLTADYQIQTGGKDIFQIVSAKKQLNRLTYSQNRILQQALLKNISEYYTWLRDIATISVVDQALKQSDTQIQTLESRFRNGFSTKLEVLQAQTLHLGNQNLQLKVINQKNISKINLASDLDIPLTTDVEPTDQELQPIHLIDENVELIELFELAEKNRYELKEIKSSIEQAKAEYHAAFADLFPTIGISGFIRGIGPSMDQLDRSTQGNLSVSVNLLRNMGLGTVSNIVMSKERITEAILNKEKQLNEIEKSLSAAFYDFMLYKDQLKVTKQKTIETEEAYRIAMARVKNGIGINLDAVKAQTDLTEANLEHKTTVMNYNNAQLKLLYETGQLTPQRIALGFTE